MTDSARPRVVVAMPEPIERLVFDDALRERLRRCTRPDPGAPLHPLEGAEAEQRLARAEILVTGWGTPALDDAVLARAPGLRFVSHAAGTVKSLVTPALWRRGVRVSSAAAANAIPVAEFTLAAILLAGKRAFRVRESYSQTRAATWGHGLPRVGNYRRRIGLVGGGSRVGRRVIALLRLFDLEVVVADPFLEPAEAAALGVERVSLDELLSTSDVVSLHAPALPETRHMIGARGLARMRDGATLVNTARGALVDHAALERELVSGRIEAVIDTTEPEVLPGDSPLYELPNVFLTPHIAGALGDETLRLTASALDEVERFAAGTALQHEVREAELDHLA